MNNEIITQKDDIRNTFKKEMDEIWSKFVDDEKYYKPIKTKDAFDGNYHNMGAKVKKTKALQKHSEKIHSLFSELSNPLKKSMEN